MICAACRLACTRRASFAALATRVEQRQAGFKAAIALQVAVGARIFSSLAIFIIIAIFRRKLNTIVVRSGAT